MRATNWLDAGAVRIIDEALAKRYFPDRNPIGAQIGNDGKWATIIGVVGTVHDGDLAVEPAGTIYIPGYAGSTVIVRTAANPLAIVSSLNEQLHSVSGDVAAYDIEPMSQLVSQSLVRQRFAMTLLGLFALAALALSFVGVYGVTAYRMTRRIHEIGLRIALGAQCNDAYGAWLRFVRRTDRHFDRLRRFVGVTTVAREPTLRRRPIRFLHADFGGPAVARSDGCSHLYPRSTRHQR
jgi:hypothetical protein